MRRTASGQHDGEFLSPQWFQWAVRAEDHWPTSHLGGSWHLREGFLYFYIFIPRQIQAHSKYFLTLTERRRGMFKFPFRWCTSCQVDKDRVQRYTVTRAINTVDPLLTVIKHLTRSSIREQINILWLSCHVLFKLTEKLALQKEMPYTTSNMLYQVSFRIACLRMACPETPNAVTGKEEKSVTDGGVKTSCPQEWGEGELFPTGVTIFSPRREKCPALGVGSQRSRPGNSVMAELGPPADRLKYLSYLCLIPWAAPCTMLCHLLLLSTYCVYVTANCYRLRYFFLGTKHLVHSFDHAVQGTRILIYGLRQHIVGKYGGRRLRWLLRLCMEVGGRGR